MTGLNGSAPPRGGEAEAGSGTFPATDLAAAGAAESPTAPDAASGRARAEVFNTKRREPLYFVVLLLLCLDIVLGLGLAVFAEEVIGFRPMALMGIGLALVGLGILAYFVLWGDKNRPRKAAKGPRS